MFRLKGTGVKTIKVLKVLRTQKKGVPVVDPSLCEYIYIYIYIFIFCGEVVANHICLIVALIVSSEILQVH